MPERAPRQPNPAEGVFLPDVTVATVVLDQGRMLMVEERVRGQPVINQPAGHLESGESLHDAAVRETLEETAWEVALSHFVGVYQWTDPAECRQFLRLVFAATPVRWQAGRALDAGIVRTLWLTPEELEHCRPRHRSPLVWRAATDCLAGQRWPLAAVRQLT